MPYCRFLLLRALRPVINHRPCRNGSPSARRTSIRCTSVLSETLRPSRASSPIALFFTLPGRPAAPKTCDMSAMEQWRQQIEEWVRQQPIEQLYVAIAVLVLTLAFFGLCTVTSMEPNDGTFVLHFELEKKRKLNPVRLVDVPGHSQLRPKLDEFLLHAAGVIFVVDSLEFLPNCRAAAEFLYDILTKTTVAKQRIPILILCNKADKVMAHSKEFIRKQLEKEIDKLCASRGSAISAADLTSEYTLGVPGKAFNFSHCRNKVTVAEASGLTGEISQVEQFIRELVKP